MHLSWCEWSPSSQTNKGLARGRPAAQTRHDGLSAPFRASARAAGRPRGAEHWRDALRRIETGLGIAAGVAGLAALAANLLLPVYRWQAGSSASESSGGESLVSAGPTPGLLAFLFLVGALCVAVAAGAWADARGGSAWSLAVLCASTLLLLIAAGITLPSIGVTLLPAVILALLASGSAALARR